MREIKFRAWDTEKNIWVSNGEIEFYLSEGDMVVVPNTIEHIGDSTHDNYVSGRFKVVQFTGLKDKNGVEIYEGDIIKGLAYYDQGNGPFIEQSIVEYKAPGFNFGRINVVFTTGVPDTQNLEVIGNIYENPELLEAEL